MSEHVVTPNPPDAKTLRRVVTAGFLGTTIEYYDFFIYGTAAALVFPKVFFPTLGDAASVAASFATFGVAFVARPLGGLLFGHIGDRRGRKTTLVMTLLIMGLSTALIGLLPSGDSIGTLAPLLLVALRFLQGLAVGGEWSSAALFVGEYAPREKRGLYALSPTLGTSAGILLATVAFLLAGGTLSNDQFLSWGWRLPFLFSVVLVAVGMWVRLRVSDTPVFRAAAERSRDEAARRAPLVQLLRHQGRETVLASGTVLMWISFFYIGSVYMTNYGTETLGFSRNTMLTVNALAIGANIIGSVAGAWLSDLWGRRTVMIATALVAVPLAYVLFALADTGELVPLALGISAVLFCVGAASGTTTAFLPEIFHTSYRSTATGVSYNLGSLLAGAVPPIVAAPLLAAYGSAVVASMLALLAALSALSALLLGETRGRSLHDHPSAPREALADGATVPPEPSLTYEPPVSPKGGAAT
ncbi:MFS transporter [Streptomyces sp. NPDC005438]|uniref:MFS transporter n=1 Tax=Streptomyces sp. NPDC005438 TaxID=3156880 RepID=UPI0033AD9916